MGGTPSAFVESKAPTLDLEPGFYCTYPEGQSFAGVDGTVTSTLVKSNKGIASIETTPYTCVHTVYEEAKKKFGNKIAMRVERDADGKAPALVKGKAPPAMASDKWVTWTWNQYYDECTAAAKALISLGMEKHDSVSVFGFNSPEWFMAATAAMFAGGKVAGIYPTDTAEQVQYKIELSGAVCAVVEDESKMKKLLAHIDDTPKLKAIVCWSHTPAEKEHTRADGSKCLLMTWKDFIALGASDAKYADIDEGKSAEEDTLDNLLQRRQDKILPSHCCALIFTSGTTGNPKAVMISHDNIIFEAKAIFASVPIIGNEKAAERILSYLPLSHVAGMMVDIVTPVVITAWSSGWGEVSFARPYDLKVGTLGERLRAVRPTIFLGVPRVWEKIAEKLKAIGATTKGIKKKLSTWAKKKGIAYARNTQMGCSGKYPSNYKKAQKIVLSKIKAALGLECCKFGFTGAAPITTDTLEYFGQLGIQINEVYGMSECTGAVTVSTESAHVWGSCGFCMPGCEVKCFIVNPDDVNDKTECKKVEDLFNAPEDCQGEICFRGRNIMMGYMAQPDMGEEHVKTIQKKTAEAIDAEGWLHSGDKGCIDVRGMVRITGRYKELIIGSGGENIAPVPIEDGVKKIRPGISNIMMIGDKRKFNVALVTLKAVGATGEMPGSDDLDGEAVGVSDAKTISAAMKDEKWHQYITSGIAEVNKGVTPPSRIQRFSILPADFSVSTEELTPTLKLKRSVVEKKWATTVDKLYGEADKGQCYFEYVPIAE